jgi:hypothetical protein
MAESTVRTSVFEMVVSKALMMVWVWALMMAVL